jgi:hypothetical protein
MGDEWRRIAEVKRWVSQDAEKYDTLPPPSMPWSSASAMEVVATAGIISVMHLWR